MKTFKFFLPVLLLALIVLAFGQTGTVDTLDQHVINLMQEFGAPALSVAIVENGEIQYCKGFGTRTIGRDESVDEHTLFAIGSISKSFTALSLAILVDEGKLDWDDKVIKYLPYFQLYDPWVTHSITIRDLLTHRSGLKSVSGGTLWYHSDLTREEVIRGMKYLKPVSAFRTKPAYQNIMFLVASKVAEAASGESWDDFVRQRIFKPLKMNDTVILQEERRNSKNISTPHIKDANGHIIPIEQEKLDNIAPAGSFYSSAIDMARYMNFMLNDGVVGTDTLVSSTVFHELIKPQFHFQIYPEPLQNEFTSYGFGWWLTPKDGNTIIEHSGGVDGAVAKLTMVKNKKFGVVAFTNNNAAYNAIRILTSEEIGKFLHDPDFIDMRDQARKRASKRDSIRSARSKSLADSQVKGTSLSLPLEEYAATYTDPMVDDIQISKTASGLQIQFSHSPFLTGELTHWHYDTFEIDWQDPRVPNGFVTFDFNSKGKIIGFKIDQPRLLDVDFTELDIKRKPE